MQRRLLLTLPALALLPAAVWAWQDGVSEVRYGHSGPGGAARARALQGRLGVRVVLVPLQGRALAEALDGGHVEFAALDRATDLAARGLMGERLLPVPGGVVRRVLPMRGS